MAEATPTSRVDTLKNLPFLGAVLVIAGAACTGPEVDTLPAEHEQRLVELHTAEESFAAAALRTGTKEAFLQFLAPASILFRPGPVDGRAFIEGVPGGGGVLEWGPRYVEMSLAGDLGFTFGPWTAHDSAGGAVAWGEFTSVWRRQADGSLRVALDGGTSFPEEEAGASRETLAPPGVPEHPEASSPEVALADLSEQDRNGEFARPASEASIAPPRFFRNGSASTHSPPSAEGEPRRWEPAGGGVSESGDLGYTYGTAFGADDMTSFAYLHVWRWGADAGWVLAFDVTTPF